MTTDLTPRERQILDRLWNGEESKYIAECLGISVKTVEAHRNNLRRKMGARNVAELIRRGLQEGVLTL